MRRNEQDSSCSVLLGFCAQRKLGAPQGYADAFRRLADAGMIDGPLARRLMSATGFRNVVAHPSDALDMARVYQAASLGPRDLRTFLDALHRIIAP
jgi:uncharacterized protein YutE (UPF0331/DUF86 family)